jgi:hypothetical protein
LTQIALVWSQVCLGGDLHTAPQSVSAVQPQRQSPETGSVTQAVPVLVGQVTQSRQVPEEPQALCWFPVMHCPADEQQKPPLQVPSPGAVSHWAEQALLRHVGVPAPQAKQSPLEPQASFAVPLVQVPLGVAEQQPPLHGRVELQSGVH